MPPRPPPPPAGFAWLAKLPTPQAWTYVNQSTGGVYQVTDAVGTDGAAPCIALYVRINETDCYVAHVDNSITNVPKADVPAITDAAAARWQAVAEANNIVIDPDYLSYFMAAGASDPVFAQGFTAGIIGALGGAPIQPWATLKDFGGFIYPGSEAPASTPILIGSKGPESFNWEANQVDGADAWTLKKDDAGVITF